MSDEKDFGLEETKSTIIDYFLLFKQTQFVVISILVLSAILFSLFHQILFNVVKSSRDLGIVYTIPDSPFAFVHPLDAAFIMSMTGFVITPGILVILAWLFYVTIIRGRKLQRRLIDIQSNLIRKSYLTNFELVEPQIIVQGGDPKLEKFMNHLSLVFSDINKINQKRLKKNKPVEKYFRYKRQRFHSFKNYFLGFTTDLGAYVTQYFEKTVTVEDIQKIIKHLFKEKVFWGVKTNRIIILGEKFDSSFDDENIIQTMNEFKRKFKVDIILQDEYGYSAIWID